MSGHSNWGYRDHVVDSIFRVEINLGAFLVSWKETCRGPGYREPPRQSHWSDSVIPSVELRKVGPWGT